ncbi:hypothetical protein ACIRPK_13835 [Kitasatospora sp. NPDC101801]|uniref:hypothetical protein n=1 Tax=Kitasatospora sp. NPDC101801 TaxID=3364103 RepID=UPI0037F6B285
MSRTGLADMTFVSSTLLPRRPIVSTPVALTAVRTPKADDPSPHPPGRRIRRLVTILLCVTLGSAVTPGPAEASKAPMRIGTFDGEAVTGVSVDWGSVRPSDLERTPTFGGGTADNGWAAVIAVSPGGPSQRYWSDRFARHTGPLTVSPQLASSALILPQGTGYRMTVTLTKPVRLRFAVAGLDQSQGSVSFMVSNGSAPATLMSRGMPLTAVVHDQNAVSVGGQGRSLVPGSGDSDAGAAELWTRTAVDTLIVDVQPKGSGSFALSRLLSPDSPTPTA